VVDALFKIFGYFKKFAGSGLFFLPLHKLTDEEKHRLSKYEGGLMEIKITDPRQISAEQRAKIYAMLGDIDKAQEYCDVDYVKQFCKTIFCYEKTIDWFSLSNCSMELASDFIAFLIDLCLRENIPWRTRTMDLINGDYWLCYYGLKHRQCCICREPADIAHITAIGRTNRKKISHVGKYVMPLCRNHHGEQHNIGIPNFMRKYHIKGVLVNQEIAEMLKLGNWRTGAEEEEIKQ
jgi:hypothetical protein